MENEDVIMEWIMEIFANGIQILADAIEYKLYGKAAEKRLEEQKRVRAERKAARMAKRMEKQA